MLHVQTVYHSLPNSEKSENKLENSFKSNVDLNLRKPRNGNVQICLQKMYSSLSNII